MNSFNGIGRLVKDPITRQTASGTTVTNFTIAINRSRKNEKGEYEADFINCTAWGKQAESIDKYVFKGHRVGVEGSIRTSTYEKDGIKQYKTEINVFKVVFLEPKNKTNNEVEVNDDDLPF